LGISTILSFFFLVTKLKGKEKRQKKEKKKKLSSKERGSQRVVPDQKNYFELKVNKIDDT